MRLCLPEEMKRFTTQVPDLQLKAFPLRGFSCKIGNNELLSGCGNICKD